MSNRFSRRTFLQALALSAAGLRTQRPNAAERRGSDLRLGMMLQGNSASELQTRARAIAEAGFDTVQLSFFFAPSLQDLKGLAQTLRELHLQTVAFGVYFNLFRPDDTGFMGGSEAIFKMVAQHADLFGCSQFVSWSGSYSAQFTGSDPCNHTSAATAQLRQAVEKLVLPVIEPLNGRLLFEPFYLHVVGTIELAKEALTPYPTSRVGLVLDPPNLLSPALYPKHDDEMRRLFRELGDRLHLAHFKDMKLNPSGQSVDYPGPGGGEMNYPLLLAEIRNLPRPIPCIIEHISAETAIMAKTKAWIKSQL